MKISRSAFLLTSGAMLSVVLAVFIALPDGKRLERKPPPKGDTLPTVSVISVKNDVYQSFVTGFGEAKPKHELSIQAEISGQVIKLSEQLYSGLEVKKNAVVIEVEPYPYLEALAKAKSELASAEVELLQQELNREQALADWKRSGLTGQPDSELVLYKPQVSASEAKVMFSKQAVLKAEQDLKKTKIKVPMNAQIIERHIEMGSFIQPGNELVTLYGSDSVEVSVPLSENQWQLLPKKVTDDWKVVLFDRQTNQKWPAQVNRIEKFINSDTRQRALVVEVKQPLKQTPPLFPGNYLSAKIYGNLLQDVWKIPASAVTETNQVWYLSSNNTLKKVNADILFSEKAHHYITPINHQEQADIVIYPLGSYMENMKVRPTMIEEMPL